MHHDLIAIGRLSANEFQNTEFQNALEQLCVVFHWIPPFTYYVIRSSLSILYCVVVFLSSPVLLSFRPKSAPYFVQQKSPEISLRAFCSSRRLPIFTSRFQLTIFGTSELNFCVRNGNRWDLTVIDTDQSDWISITHFCVPVQCFLEGRAFKTE